MNRYGTQGYLDTNPALAWTIIILILVIAILGIAGTWKTFTKAGKPGWAAIIPIYNSIVMAEIAEKPIWMALGASLGGLIPMVGIFVSWAFSIILGLGIAEKFGKSQGFGVGLGLLAPIFFPILGFGDAQYQGNGAVSTGSDDVLDA